MVFARVRGIVGFACAVLALSGGPARAAAPRLTVRAYDEDPRGPELAAPVEEALGQTFANDSRFRFTPLADLLEPPAEAAAALAKADQALTQAEDDFKQMDLDNAQKLLEGAIATYQRYLPALAARPTGTAPFRDAWIKMSKVRFFNGDNDGARDALRYVYVLDPKVEFDPQVFPPQMRRAVIESKLLFDTLGPGKLTIDSDPNGGTAWLNGKRLDKPTPTDAVDAPPGPNYVTVRRRGWTPQTIVVEVSGSGQATSGVVSLKRYPKRPIASIEQARQSLDLGDTPPHLADAAQALGVDLLVLVRFAEATQPDGDTRLTAYLYDARPNRILARASKVVPAAQAPEAAHALATEVTRQIGPDGVWVRPKPPVKPSAWHRFWSATGRDFDRFHHWKYFWYVVGGTAGAVALGVGLGVGLGVHHQAQIGDSVVLLGGN